MPLTLIQQKPTFDKKVEGEDKLAIAEMFCDTIQGEGPNAGVISTFMRLQGCTLKCVWCFPGSTKVLMSDYTYRDIKDVREGDLVKTYSRGGLIDTKVVASAPTRESSLVRVTLENGHTVECTPDHKFKAYDDPHSPSSIRARDIPAKDLLGKYVKQMPNFLTPINKDLDYYRGYLKGVAAGDGNFQPPYRMKLECVDLDMVIAFGEALQKVYGYQPTQRLIKNNKPNQNDYWRLVVTRKDIVLELSATPSQAEMRGFIAGFFDAEGHTNKSELTITQKQKPVLESIASHIEQNLNLRSQITYKRNWNGYELSVKGGQAAVVKFLTHYNPSIKRKMDVAYLPSQYKTTQRVVSVEHVPDSKQLVYSLQTEKGTYIAEDVWVRNCDTLDVWPHGNEYSFEEIFEMWEKVGLIDRLEKGQHLILTGGSPLKQEQRLINFIVQFVQRYGFKPYIEVENEAVLMPSQQFVDIVDWWNNSPKLANSGMKPRVRIKPDVLTFMGRLHNSCFKFVVASDQDWEEIQTDFINPGFIAKNKIVIMPEGQTQEELSKTREMAADMAIKHQVRFTDRLHVTIWDRATAV